MVIPAAGGAGQQVFILGNQPFHVADKSLIINGEIRSIKI
jgi:hypothetical protein